MSRVLEVNEASIHSIQFIDWVVCVGYNCGLCLNSFYILPYPFSMNVVGVSVHCCPDSM